MKCDIHMMHALDARQFKTNVKLIFRNQALALQDQILYFSLASIEILQGVGILTPTAYVLVGDSEVRQENDFGSVFGPISHNKSSI